jgi:hypothetical protein
MIACKKCCGKVARKTYTLKFDPASDQKFLDMNQHFVKSSKSRRKKLKFTPALKNLPTLQGKSDSWVSSGVAPWWSPYPPRVLASTFYGFLVRFRTMMDSESERTKFLGWITAEYVFRGYRLRDIRHAWSLTEWTPERQEMLRRLKELKKRKVNMEGVDWFAPDRYRGSLRSSKPEDSERKGVVGGGGPLNSGPEELSLQVSRERDKMSEVAGGWGKENWGGNGGNGGGHGNQGGGQWSNQWKGHQQDAGQANPPGSKKIRKQMAWQAAKKMMGQNSGGGRRRWPRRGTRGKPGPVVFTAGDHGAGPLGGTTGDDGTHARPDDGAADDEPPVPAAGAPRNDASEHDARRGDGWDDDPRNLVGNPNGYPADDGGSGRRDADVPGGPGEEGKEKEGEEDEKEERKEG